MKPLDRDIASGIVKFVGALGILLGSFGPLAGDAPWGSQAAGEGGMVQESPADYPPSGLDADLRSCYAELRSTLEELSMRREREEHPSSLPNG